MANNEVRATIVVVPRESFNIFPEVIERIYQETPPNFKMLIMEGKAPEPIREKLREFERTKSNCKVVWSDRWLFPYEAVNQALEIVDTEFIAFIDNDVEVMKGWFEPLIKAADENPTVGCFHPIYLTTTLKNPIHKIHVAEGKYVREQRDGKLFLDSVMPFSGTSLEDYPNRDQVRESDYFEWHAVFFRTSFMKKIGPLNDLTIAEHVDYSLRIAEAGEKILLVPNSVGAYDYERIFKLRGEDRDYLLYRWGVDRAAESLEKLRKRWNLHPDASARRIYWVKEHTGRVRQTFVTPRIINKLRRTVGLPNMPFTREKKPETVSASK